MGLSRRKATAALLWLAAAAPAHADEYPSKPVRIVVPTGAGGITDIVARIVAARLGERIGQNVLIDNRPGASGIIGSEIVARSPPDGYTLLMVFPSHPVNPALKLRLPYDTIRDFTPITTVTTVSLVLVTPPGLAAQDIASLIALAKRDRLTYASVGAGSLGHLGAELFRSMAAIELTNIAYRSAPDAQAALLRGEVSMFFDTPITAAGHVRDGRLRALGVSTRERSELFPGVPAIAEALPGYEVLGWNGILAPAATPAPIVERLNREILAIIADPDVKRQLDQQGAAPAPSSPEAFGQLIRDDIAKWAEIIRQAGIRPD